MKELSFSQAIVSLIRECMFPVPGLAGISGILMVLLGTMDDNCFCLPFEMKHIFCCPLTGSIHCPSASSAQLNLLVLQPMDLKMAPSLPH